MLGGLNCKLGKASSRMMAVACCALVVTVTSLLSTPKAEAIDLIPVCKEHFDRFEKWNEYYKVFAYGRGNGRAGCASARGEDEAIAKCEKALDTWGVNCRVYAQSPVNGGLAIVWDGPSSIKTLLIAQSKQNPTELVATESYRASTDRSVCENALSKIKGGANPWDSVGARAWVVEAYRRDFSPDFCARLLGRAGQVTSSLTTKLAKYPKEQISDHDICLAAVKPNKTEWSNDQHAVVNAKSRGLGPSDCALIVQSASLPDMSICKQALVSEHLGIVAFETSRYFREVQEAKRRGFTAESCAQLVESKVQTARLEEERKRKQAGEQAKLQAEAEEKAKQERARKTEVERQNGLIVGQQRQLTKARIKHLAPLRKKNRHSFAVIIGNKNYKGRTPKVSYAHNDADAMKRFVLERLAYREGNVIDLRDATRNEIATMFGNKDTHKGRLFNIIRAGKSDVTVFYSGHGVPGLDNRRPYLLPVDGDPNLAEITGYPVDVLYSNLAKLPARSITVYLDACFSGESEKGMLISATSGISVTPKIPKSKSWMTVITAAQGDQFASWDEKAKHGLFTKHLLEALNGKADTEDFGNSDGNVSLAEVRNYLDDEMTYQARFMWNRQQKASVRGQDNTVLASVFKMPKGLSDVASIEEMDATYVVLKSANLRAGPSTDTSVVGKLKANQSVNVTGRVIGKNWYRLNDGSFVFGSLIRVGE
jgi:hypothetical protein